jgi:hypothetical protein
LLKFTNVFMIVSLKCCFPNSEAMGEECLTVEKVTKVTKMTKMWRP